MLGKKRKKRKITFITCAIFQLKIQIILIKLSLISLLISFNSI